MGKLIMIISIITLGLTGCKVDPPMEEVKPVINQSGDIFENPSGEKTN